MMLNEVKEMKSQGMQDSDIIQNLTERGVSYSEIQQALEQSNIKTAIQGEDMQPSLMAQQGEYQPSQEQVEYSPQADQAPYPQEQSYPQYQQYPQAQSPQQPQYPPYQDYQPASDTISEISEQIVEEKLNQVKKEISKLGDFKTVSSKRIEDLDNRLARIESMLDKIQSSILGKIGDHMQNIQDIKGEMNMMQESFSKVLNPLVDRARHSSPHPEVKKIQERKNKKEQTFEDLLER